MKRVNVQKLILSSVKIAGLISLALFAPNAVSLLKSLDNKSRKKNPKYVVNSSINNLIDKGLIFFEEKNGKKFISLTTMGEEKLKLLENKEYKINKPKYWDKKWRIVIFDIPETKKYLRDKLRLTLLSIGFKKLQHSVWVYPYECEELLIMLKADFKIGKEVLYILVEKIENDRWLKEYFKL